MPMCKRVGSRDGKKKGIARAINFNVDWDIGELQVNRSNNTEDLAQFEDCLVKDEGTLPDEDEPDRNSSMWDSGIECSTPALSRNSCMMDSGVNSLASALSRNSSMWNSEFESPTPGASSCKRSKELFRRLKLSQFNLNSADENNPRTGTIDAETPKRNHASMSESGIFPLPTASIQDPVHRETIFPLFSPVSSHRINTPQRTPCLQPSRRRIVDDSRSVTNSARNTSKFCRLRNLTSTVKGKADEFKENCFDGIEREDRQPQINVNPFAFSPDSAKRITLKRSRKEYEKPCGSLSPMKCTDAEYEDRLRKKLNLRYINTSRLKEEFQVFNCIGDGNFGTVYRCVNRLDGCTYAIKRSKDPIAGTTVERSALREVFAHSVLGKHIHIVGYYSAWAEQDHLLLYIQSEYCNGGSLSRVLCDNRLKGKTFTELELRQLMCQLVHGLQYIHSHDLAHLDLKPDNIFLSIDKSNSFMQDSFCESLEDEGLSPIIYKIGDFGMVTSISNPTNIDEGDCRYLPKELLREDYSQLQKADIFSLALTFYEAGSGMDLPKNGPQWHQLRDEPLPNIAHVSADLNNLLKLMSCSNASLRPSSVDLSRSRLLLSSAKKINKDLRRELDEQKSLNEHLSRPRELEKLKNMFHKRNYRERRNFRAISFEDNNNFVGLVN